MRKYLVAILGIVLSMLVSVPVFAATISNPANLFLGDEEISKEVNTDGDVYSFGSTVDLSGKSQGDVISIAGDIKIKDIEIGGSIRTISGNLTIAADKVRNITSIAETILIDSNTVARGIYVMGSNIEFLGTADEFSAIGDNIIINGTINGDVKVECKTLVIGENAKISGKLVVKGEKEPEIIGDYDKANMTFTKTDGVGTPNIRTVLVDKLLSLASALLVGLTLILLCKNYLIKSHERLLNRTWIPFVIGFSTLIALPIAAIFTMITVIGMPIAFISLIIYSVLIYLAPVITGIIIGPFILRKKDFLLAAFVGVVLVKVLTFIPIVGFIVSLGAIFLSLGVFVMNIGEILNNVRLKG